ncbi:MAG: hypothetical protein Unbinned8261contig1001_23 [Prokaryotic dsDNA virus sp.]|nr:MAG: hypothetical protein Unbinned8261contig1001_23 [Prokaryotic dsDNA virus sp.]|tara:strand:- start:24921 stop:25133 length:213 start_codon:yes stop_codon:yes gene_type:complete
MIKFIKTPHHFKHIEDTTEGVTINIETNGQTLGEITEAFNKFLTACGFQVIQEYELLELDSNEDEDEDEE